MLVLTRMLDGVVKIGDEIEVTVVSIRGGKVRLGIVAPKGLAVHRAEVYARIMEQPGRKTGARISVGSGPVGVPEERPA